MMNVCVSVFDLDETVGRNRALLTDISWLAIKPSTESAVSHSFSHLGQLGYMKFGGILPAPPWLAPTQNATQRLRL